MTSHYFRMSLDGGGVLHELKAAGLDARAVLSPAARELAASQLGTKADLTNLMRVTVEDVVEINRMQSIVGPAVADGRLRAVHSNKRLT